MPTYTDWGRTRSGCYFCFYQQKIEWVRLKETYPDLYEQAKAYERPNKVNGNGFEWNQNESLEVLEQPERTAKIKATLQLSQERIRKNRKNKGLRSVLADFE